MSLVVASCCGLEGVAGERQLAPRGGAERWKASSCSRTGEASRGRRRWEVRFGQVEFWGSPEVDHPNREQIGDTPLIPVVFSREKEGVMGVPNYFVVGGEL